MAPVSGSSRSPGGSSSPSAVDGGPGDPDPPPAAVAPARRSCQGARRRGHGPDRNPGDGRPGLEGTLTIPILAGQEVVGAALLGATGGPAQRPPAAGRGRPGPPSTAEEEDEPERAPTRPGDGRDGRCARPPRRLRDRARPARRPRPRRDGRSVGRDRPSLELQPPRLAARRGADRRRGRWAARRARGVRAAGGVRAGLLRRPPEPLVRPRPRPRLPVGLAQREARLPADVDGPVARAARTGQPVEIATPEAWRREFPASPTCRR